MYHRQNPVDLYRTCTRMFIQWRTQKFFSGGGRNSTNSVEDRRQRERGSGGGSPLFRGSGGSCNLVQEIYSKIFLIVGILRLCMMTTNLFVIANLKKNANLGSFRISLPFPEHLGVSAS